MELLKIVRKRVKNNCKSLIVAVFVALAVVVVVVAGGVGVAAAAAIVVVAVFVVVVPIVPVLIVDYVILFILFTGFFSWGGSKNKKSQDVS